MNVDTTDRTELKSYFVTNAIPTQEHFANLIDAMLNQKEDGIVKKSGDPLSIQAGGNDVSKKVINFYKDFAADSAPSWVLSLNPGGKSGFDISDGTGKTGLFIDQNTGNVGIGIAGPADKLDVNGDIRIRGTNIKDAGGTARITLTDNGRLDLKEEGGAVALSISTNGKVGIGKTNPSTELEVNGDLSVAGALSFGSQTRQMINLWRTNYGIGVQSSTQYYRTDQNFAWYKGGNHSQNALDAGGGIVQMVIKNGNLGIGTSNPGYRFHVQSGDAVGMFESTGTQAYLRFITQEGIDNRVEIANRPGGRLALWVKNGGDILNITKSGNVGIGTTNPQDRLDVNGVLRFDGNANRRIHGDSRAGRDAVVLDGHWDELEVKGRVIDWTGPNLHIGYDNDHTNNFIEIGRRVKSIHLLSGGGGAETMRIENGNVGIGISNPAVKLHINGETKTNVLYLGNKFRLSGVGDGAANDGWLRLFNQANTDYYGGLAAGQLWSRSTGTLSDTLLKRNVETLKCSLKKLVSLRGTRFKWKDSQHDASYKLGLIAQEVEPVFPELVSIGPDQLKSIDYSGFIAPIVEGIKEQQNQIMKLSMDNQEQQEKIDLLISKKAGNDWAEYFESVSGKAIHFGVSVVLDGGKIRQAKKNETPIGIISANPGNVNGVHFEWPKKYLHDEFGSLIMEEYQAEIMIPKKKTITKERQKVKKKITEKLTRTDIVLKEGKYCQIESTENVNSEMEVPIVEEVDLYDATGKNIIGKHRVPVMETYEEEIEVLDEIGQPVLVGSGKFVTEKRPKINPKYNGSKEYVSREERPEWNCVGLLGQLPMLKGQPVADSWVKIKNISTDVELWLVK